MCETSVYSWNAWQPSCSWTVLFFVFVHNETLQEQSHTLTPFCQTHLLNNCTSMFRLRYVRTERHLADKKPEVFFLVTSPVISDQRRNRIPSEPWVDPVPVRTGTPHSQQPFLRSPPPPHLPHSLRHHPPLWSQILGHVVGFSLEGSTTSKICSPKTLGPS